MAQRTIVRLIDDIDGSDADETIAFSFDGRDYEIDLNAKNADKFRSAVLTYISNARTTGRRGKKITIPNANGRKPATTDKEQRRAIRAWAQENGHDVGERGRIPQEVIDAYNAQ